MTINTLLQIYILAGVACICFSFTILALIVDYKSKLKQISIFIIESSSTLILIADVFANLYRGQTSTMGFWAVRISNFLLFVLVYTGILGISLFVRSYISDRPRKPDRIAKLINLFSYIGIALIIISQFTGIFYSFDQTNHYVRGPLFVLSYVMPLALYLLILRYSHLHRKELSSQINASVVIFSVLPLAAAFAQIFLQGLSLISLAVGLSAIAAFVLSLIDQNKYLSQLASTEKQSGLPNSYGFILAIVDKIYAGNLTDFNAYYLDIARMGLFNRKYGNTVGDDIIQGYIRILKDFMDDDEVLGRLGGNYFVALVKKPKNNKFLELLSGVHVPIHLPSGDETVTINAVAGIYEITDNHTDPADIMGYISTAIASAKNVKKVPYVYFTQELLREMNEHRQLQATIPVSMANKEFKPYYQPKVDAANNILCGAEALARWEHNGELVPPARFVPIMEQNESICKFDFYMLDYVCSDIRNWLDRGLNPPVISVNFSRKNLGNKTLADDIYDVVKSHNVPPKLIQIEITETVDEYPIEFLKRVVEALQAYGISVAIDDFGTGSSSVILLKEVPFDVLKIDKSFISSINDKALGLLSHIITMAHEVGASVITEGVEDREQIDILTELGCTDIQGYFFDKPLTKADFEDRICDPMYMY